MGKIFRKIRNNLSLSLSLSLRIPFDFAFDSICKSNKITEKRPSHSSPRTREIVNRIENRIGTRCFFLRSGNENFERRKRKEEEGGKRKKIGRKRIDSRDGKYLFEVTFDLSIR